MSVISAVPVPEGDKDYIGPTYAQFKLTGYMGNSDTGILLSPLLATDKDVDEAVKRLTHEVEKAGKAAKRILSKAKKTR